MDDAPIVFHVAKERTSSPDFAYGKLFEILILTPIFFVLLTLLTMLFIIHGLLVSFVLLSIISIIGICFSYLAKRDSAVHTQLIRERYEQRILTITKETVEISPALLPLEVTSKRLDDVTAIGVIQDISGKAFTITLAGSMVGPAMRISGFENMDRILELLTRLTNAKITYHKGIFTPLTILILVGLWILCFAFIYYLFKDPTALYNFINSLAPFFEFFT